MPVMRTFLRRARRLATGGAITLAAGAGLLFGMAPAAHANVRSSTYADIRWEGSIKYPGATAIEYGLIVPHITLPRITF